MRRSRRLPLAELDPYLFVTPATAAPIDWPGLFGNHNPVELEIGFGKGLFLLNAALARPDTNFLGIEASRKYQLFAATRFAKRTLGNVRLALGDARVFLRDFIASESLQAIHIYFPDPWWKKRHQKRRLFTGEFVQQLVRVLAPTGNLHIVTDVQDYFRIIQNLLAGQADLRSRADGAEPPFVYLTNFERKFRLENRPIYRSAYTRAPRPSLQE